MAEVSRVDLPHIHGRRTVARWTYHAADHAEAHDIETAVGWIGDGRWWVRDTSERQGWLVVGADAEQAAWALARQRLVLRRPHPGRWLEEPIAEHVPGVVPHRAVDVPPRPPTGAG